MRHSNCCFGIMFEGGYLLLIGLVVASVLVAGLRKLVTRHPGSSHRHKQAR